MKGKRLFEYSFIGIFILMLLLIGTVSMIKEKESTSFYEYRTLATEPKVSVTSIANGDYFDAWETYFTDHAAGRQTLLKASTILNLNIFHRPVVNEVVVTETQLLPYLDFQNTEEETLRENSAMVSDTLAEVAELTRSYGGTFLLVTIPSAYNYFPEKYPSYLNNRADYINMEREIFFSDLEEKNVPYLAIDALWKSEGSPDHYMSSLDHHFTWDGIYSVYKATMTKLNRLHRTDLKIYQENELIVTEQPEPYLGSYARKLWGLWESTERLSYGELKEPIPFTRFDNGTEAEAKVIRIVDENHGYTDYSIYMGGDMSKTVIDTNRSELPDLLVFGDSFSNAEETLLYASFDTMTTLDFRYYDEMTLAEYVKTYQPDIVVGFRNHGTMTDPAGNGLCLPTE